MKLSIGIVGLPNVGKSTLFKLLTKQEVNIANYPFATIDPNVGVVSVPDERLQKLAKLSNSKKVIPAIVEFYDIAGLVKGSHKGEGLGNQFLSHIRETQAIVVVLRTFQNPEIIHVENSVDPLRDLETINTELALKDLETVNKRLASLEKEAKTPSAGSGQAAKAAKNLAVLQEAQKALEEGRLTARWAREEIIRELQLLTSKRQLYLLNGKDEDAPEVLRKRIGELGGNFIIVDLAEDGTAADSTHQSNSGQAGSPQVAALIKKAYEILNLISFFTTGEDETRAWTIERGTKAPQAAGVIHTDFEKNFIRLEVIPWEKLLAAGGWNQAKQKGLIKTEGKEYEAKDGDVVVVRHG